MEFLPDEDSNRRMNRAFIHAVQTGDTSGIRSDYADGFRTFELTYAMHLSAVRGEIVQIGRDY